MNRLKAIIGPAPSELPLSDLIAKLSIERARVRDALIRFRATPVKPSRAPSKKKKSAELSNLLTELNLSPEELRELIREEK